MYGKIKVYNIHGKKSDYQGPNDQCWIYPIVTQ